MSKIFLFGFITFAFLLYSCGNKIKNPNEYSADLFIHSGILVLVAACNAIDGGIGVQDVDYNVLKETLKKKNQVLKLQ